ncbi:hypothetical protein NYR95_02425 [Xanthomonas dyei]|uniref:Uncharacterized protein n=1 Tax=Xanthomonas dyei TaxID=743699 RepID=A0ABZ0D9U1_9XANT|nr:hypothetical protein [Xanthomonas dyei]WOB26876.1 hypothetical protein NYR99_02425 [Xanthomonas dyei]WOB54495.1 hypothetical protein NYR95_02425 [Xanthomonas dyei]
MHAPQTPPQRSIATHTHAGPIHAARAQASSRPVTAPDATFRITVERRDAIDKQI